MTDILPVITIPLLHEIEELLLSDGFYRMALVEFITSAPTCPSIADGPTKASEWGLASDYLKQVLAKDPNLPPNDVIGNLQGRFRSNPLTPAFSARGDDFPAVDLPQSHVLSAVADGHVLSAVADERPVVVPVRRSGITNSKAGKSLVQFGQSNDMEIVSLGADGKCTLVGDVINPGAWRAMTKSQKAPVYRLREEQEQLAAGGATAPGGAGRRPPRPPPSAPAANVLPVPQV